MTQAEALTILKTGANVFLTGEPGAGKSHTITSYVSYLRSHGVEPAITASTGIAATHIQGMTIHSWSGIGIRRTLSPYDLDHIATTEYLSRRIRNTNVLIIDEISMIDAGTLDMIDAVCRTVRQNSDPFGGMQVVVVGDFFQLPPISHEHRASFAFMAPSWKRMVPVVCYLTEQHRQNDDHFLSILSAIRSNTYDEDHHERLSARLTTNLENVSAADLTRLFPKNVSVDEINTVALNKLEGKKVTYPMYTKGSSALVSALIKGCLSPEVLELKIGAVVMCTKNNPSQRYANGTLGEVIDFAVGTQYPIIKTRDGERILIEPAEWVVEEQGKIKASISQIPLRLAWAITIHKSQGMSLDAALMDLREVFEYGQGYVALSRVRSLNGLYLLGFSRETFMVHPQILAQDEVFRTGSESAAVAFADIPPSDLQTMHNNFITAIGGTIEAQASGGKKKQKIDTLEATKELILKQESLTTIAKSRKMTSATILGHLEKLIEQERLLANDIAYLLEPKTLENLSGIHETFTYLQTDMLTPVFQSFNEAYSYDQLRIARMMK